MVVKIKKLHENAVIPKYAKHGDAGMDLVAISRELIQSKGDADFVEYKTGLSIEIPEGYVGLVFPRSSNTKKDMTLGNSVGVIDSGYRGEICFRYKIDGTYNDASLEKECAICISDDYKYTQFIHEVGDKIGQIIIMPYPLVEFEEVEELSSTNRGYGGFGSSGK
jgi:dUTP pyrophosphatase